MSLTRSGFWKRFVARLLDGAVFSLFFMANSYLVQPLSENAFVLVRFVIGMLAIVYDVLFVYYHGRTPGKMILKIKVCMDDGSKVNLLNSLKRECFIIISTLSYIIAFYLKPLSFLNNLSMIASLIDYLVFFLNNQRKTVHDYIANTIVVDEG